MASVPISATACTPVLTCHEYCWSAAGGTISMPAGALPAQVTTTAPTNVATDGLSGFTLGAALLVVLVAGYYLLGRRRTSESESASEADRLDRSDDPD